MRSWKPSRGELVFLLACAVGWLAVLCWLPQNTGNTDVYMFRDPACNFLAGLGFRSASVDHAHSFQPMLYAHYTPLCLWLFIPAAKLLGCTTLANTVFQGIWTILIDITVIVVGLRFLEKPLYRWLFLILAGILLPMSVVRPDNRPEPLSFCILLALVILLRQKPTLGSSVVAGLLGSAAFLSEPFAGVAAFFLIAGWLIADLLRDFGRLRVLVACAALSALVYALPIAITAVSFYEIDPQSLHRFMYQAINTGVSRDTTYTMGEGPTWNQEDVDHSSRLGKIKAGLTFREQLGSVIEYETAVEALIILTWLVVLIRSRGDWRDKLALAAAGLICLILPVVVFPMQDHYLVLGCALLPVMLALNWAGSGQALRHAAVISALLALLIVAELPAEGVDVLRLAEARSSYLYARGQAEFFRDYLKTHALVAPVVLVPTSHYFLYKDVAHDIYNPAFLSYRYQNPAEVGAVVNCYYGMKDFQPGTLPLPEFVRGEAWQEISASRDPVRVMLFHHQLMSRNWSMECDLYVRARS